jgi:rhamnosyltransferase
VSAGANKPPICVVTVTRDPDPLWPARFSAQVAEAAATVIVDNGSSGAEGEMIASAAARCGARLVRNDRNRGLAAALNQAADWAFGEGYRWLLLFDQDTGVVPGVGAELLRIYHLAAARRATAVVGTNFFDEAKQAPRFPSLAVGEQEWVPARTVIVSGSLIERDACRAIGPFREEFFVDSVDHDYCLRARAKGLQVALATRPLIRHRLGETSAYRALGMRIATSNHSAARRHDMGRNRLVLAREYLLREPRWVAASLFALAAETAVLLVLEADGGRKARAVVSGAWHGLRGRFDPPSAGEER